MTLISDQRLAILADHGVNQRELTVTRDIMERAGVKTEVLSCRRTEVKGWESNDWGIRLKIDHQLGEVNVEDFDGVIIPGGPLHADQMRSNPQVQTFIKQLFSAGKLIGSLGHGIQVLISSDILRELKVSSLDSLRKDVAASGAIVIDENIVSDNGVITCRSEKSLDSFTRILLDSLKKGIKQRTASII